MVLVLVRNMSIIKTLGIGLESNPKSRHALELVLIEIPNQNKAWYRSQTNFNFKTSLVLVKVGRFIYDAFTRLIFSLIPLI